jgi:Ohr subfamily peroxiredoxin
MSRLYTASATATGSGRTGRATTSDGTLGLDLVVPPEMGGDGAPGTNPEQLFALGYSACFLSALTLVAAKRKVEIGAATVSADVSLNTEGRGFVLGVELRVAVPGAESEVAEKLVETAHQVCPYSNALRGNVDVVLSVEQPAVV